MSTMDEVARNARRAKTDAPLWKACPDETYRMFLAPGKVFPGTVLTDHRQRRLLFYAMVQDAPDFRAEFAEAISDQLLDLVDHHIQRPCKTTDNLKRRVRNLVGAITDNDYATAQEMFRLSDNRNLFDLVSKARKQEDPEEGMVAVLSTRAADVAVRRYLEGDVLMAMQMLVNTNVHPSDCYRLREKLELESRFILCYPCVGDEVDTCDPIMLPHGTILDPDVSGTWLDEYWPDGLDGKYEEKDKASEERDQAGDEEENKESPDEELAVGVTKQPTPEPTPESTEEPTSVTHATHEMKSISFDDLEDISLLGEEELAEFSVLDDEFIPDNSLFAVPSKAALPTTVPHGTKHVYPVLLPNTPPSDRFGRPIPTIETFRPVGPAVAAVAEPADQPQQFPMPEPEDPVDISVPIPAVVPEIPLPALKLLVGNIGDWLVRGQAMYSQLQALVEKRVGDKRVRDKGGGEGGNVGESPCQRLRACFESPVTSPPQHTVSPMGRRDFVTGRLFDSQPDEIYIQR